MGWQTVASGTATDRPNVTLEAGEHRIVVTVPAPLGGLASAIANAIGGLVGATRVETSGNSVSVYFTVR